MVKRLDVIEGCHSLVPLSLKVDCEETRECGETLTPSIATLDSDVSADGGTSIAAKSDDKSGDRTRAQPSSWYKRRWRSRHYRRRWRVMPESIDDSNPKNDHAYCALLHGDEHHFFLYALIVGRELKKLCHAVPADTVLMCAGRWWDDKNARAALKRVYTRVQAVPIIPAAHATKAPRHINVFTKLWCFSLPYKHVVLLDLDITICADLSPLFDVQAPAGLHHGSTKGQALTHGEPIQKSKGDVNWCVNAGALRIDPKPARHERQQEMRSMIHEIRNISHPTYLPEQYYLVKRIPGWRQIGVAWNMEVGSSRKDPGFTWPRKDARKAAEATCRGPYWCAQDVVDVNVFHFSGTNIDPWWYVNFSPYDAWQAASREWQHRDPRRLIATAVHNWCSGLEGLRADAVAWPDGERLVLEHVTDELSIKAKSLWDRMEQKRKSHALGCHRCKQEFACSEGRWLVGWEGWWLCFDCIVGYIWSDEDPPDPVCVRCNSTNRAATKSDEWDWNGDGSNDHPWRAQWKCGTCIRERYRKWY